MLFSKCSSWTIGIIANKDILCHRVLQRLSKLNLDKSCLRIFNNEPCTLRYGESSVKTESLEEEKFLQCDLIINLVNNEFMLKYGADILAENIRVIDLSSQFIDDIQLSVSINEMASNLVMCPNGFIIALHKFIEHMKQVINIKNICIAGYRGYTDYNAGDALLDETKRTFFEPRINNHSFDNQIAFNAFANTKDVDIRCIKKIIRSPMNFNYNSVNIPILNLEGAVIYMSTDDEDGRSSIKSDAIIKSMECDPNKFCISSRGSVLEASHESQIYIHGINVSNKTVSMFIYFDPFEQQISELTRLVELVVLK